MKPTVTATAGTSWCRLTEWRRCGRVHSMETLNKEQNNMTNEPTVDSFSDIAGVGGAKRIMFKGAWSSFWLALIFGAVTLTNALNYEAGYGWTWFVLLAIFLLATGFAVADTILFGRLYRILSKKEKLLKNR